MHVYELRVNKRHESRYIPTHTHTDTHTDTHRDRQTDRQARMQECKNAKLRVTSHPHHEPLTITYYLLPITRYPVDHMDMHLHIPLHMYAYAYGMHSLHGVFCLVRLVGSLFT